MRNDLTGQRFGRLVALYATKTVNNKIYWMCRCDCGNEKEIRANSLTTGHTSSCGCLALELSTNRVSGINKTHGCRKIRLYSIWKSMKARCNNPNHKSYSRYGGRGITVCDEWNSSFVPFRDWAVSHGYDDCLTLDRMDSNGNYEPGNCRWATMKEQQQNRQNNIRVVYQGEEMVLSEAVRRSGVPRTRIAKQLLA